MSAKPHATSTVRARVRPYLLLALGAPGAAPADPPAAARKPADAGILETQLTVLLESKGKVARFRGTTLSAKDGRITVLTAGHCLAPGDEGGRVVIRRDGQDAEVAGTVDRVARNPFYVVRPQPGDAPGADGAIAVLKVEGEEEARAKFLASLRTARLTQWPYPAERDRLVTITMRDQKGAEYTVRAANYSNPQWLEWGPSFRPIPGDSGSGMFLLLPSREGPPTPILIGVLVDRSQYGGGGSIICTKYDWVARALEPPKAP